MCQIMSGVLILYKGAYISDQPKAFAHSGTSEADVLTPAAGASRRVDLAPAVSLAADAADATATPPRRR